MLSDVVRLEQNLRALGYDASRTTAARTIIRFLEKRFGAEFLIRRERLMFGREDMAYLGEIASKLQRSGIIERSMLRPSLPDEPQIRTWVTKYKSGTGKFSGGSSLDNDVDALTASLAESLERYLWQEHTDHFRNAFEATNADATRKGAIDVSRFAGFSAAQRNEHPKLSLHGDSSYLWVSARSLVQNKRVYIPAQIISAKYARDTRLTEPTIRMSVTTGLATGPTPTFAMLGGALEVIERDAYMIMWMNQLTLPRFDPYSVGAAGGTLHKLLDRCERHRLKVSAIRLLTDAPAYAIAAVIEDAACSPPATIGLKAHRDPGSALEGAILEALRARMTVRTDPAGAKQAAAMQAADVQLEHRVKYWSDAKRSPHLSFLTAGPLGTIGEEAWMQDTSEAHLQRIVAWVRERGYELVVADVGRSAMNPLPWHVYVTVIPEMQPLHLIEKYPYLGGSRLQSVPEKFGCTPLSSPFRDQPHPLA